MAVIIKRRPYEFCFSGNPMHYRLYSADAAADSSIFFEIKVMFKKIADVVYEEVVTLPYYPVAGQADINIQDIIDSKLEFQLPAFDVNEKLFTEATTQTGNFYIKFRQVSVAIPDPSWSDSESGFYRNAIKGGIDYFKWRGNNFFLNYYVPPQYPFFTWQKSGRLAVITERMYLAYYNLSNATNLLAVAKVYYTNGDTNSVSQAIGGAYKNVIYIPSGARQWDLDSLDIGKRIHYWTIEVQNVDNVDDPITVSEVFAYYADNKNDYNDVTLNYRNSLGGLDSVRVRGAIEHNLNYEFTAQDKTFAPDYFDGDEISPRRVINNSKERKVWKGDIGWISKEDQDRFRDAHLRRELYWERKKKWFPVVAETGNVKQKISGQQQDQLFAFPIEFALAGDGENYYTPDAVDLGDGVFTSNVCLSEVLSITYDADLSGADAVVTITIAFTDPDNVSSQYFYQIDSDAPVLMDLGALPLIIHLPKDALYTFAAWLMCPNNIPGRRSSIQIDTHEPTPPPGGSTECHLNNFTSNESDYVVKIDNVEVDSGHVGAYGIDAFSLIDYVDVQLRIVMNNFLPFSATMTSNGNTYIGSIGGAVITFNHVDITSGCEVNVN